MPFAYTNRKGTTYYLHSKSVQLQHGIERTIYFFARDIREQEALDAVPDGYEVSESANRPLPVLKKKSS